MAYDVIDNPCEAEAREAFGCAVKRCLKCGEFLPADFEFYYKQTRSPDGLNTVCKVCWYEWMKEKKDDARRQLVGVDAAASR
jgi:hypothetical protein